MPVLESANGGTPRSTLRYRSLNETSKRSIVTTATHPVIQRASRVRPRPADDDLISEWARGDVDESERVTEPERETEMQRKMSQPARRVSSDVKRLASVSVSTSPSTRRVSSDVKRLASVSALAWPQERARVHPLLFLSLGMLGMVVLWVLLSASLGWWNGMLDDLHYGYPRTFQKDAVVGHNDSASHLSHFIALNLHGHIEIMEFPGGDATHTRIYIGPQLFGTDADKAPVTLQFIDINGDKKPDMLVFFQSSWIVFINRKGTFRSPTVNEQQDAERYLAAHRQS
jgi:hypothetical protein